MCTQGQPVCKAALQTGVNGHKLGYYRADFRYRIVETGATVTEDVKSPATKTPVYQRKQKACEGAL
jgi:hypothetical protein